jgi:hypothetical protein
MSAVAPPEASTEPKTADAASGVEWSEYPLVAACARPPGEPEILDRALTIVVSEDEYRRSFCRRSGIDWGRFRLAVYAEALAPRRVSLEGVVRDGDALLLVLRHPAVCEVNDYEFQYETVAVLIPNAPEQVRTFFAPGPTPPC